MIDSKERIEFIDAQPEPIAPKRRGGVRDILNGNIFNKQTVSGQVPYILFLALLALIYITNRYRYEKLIRTGQAIQVEVKNLRAESITTASQLMFISKQSQVSKLVKERELGLVESVEPPKKIVARLK
jgi:hypothetical protein